MAAQRRITSCRIATRYVEIIGGTISSLVMRLRRRRDGASTRKLEKHALVQMGVDEINCNDGRMDQDISKVRVYASWLSDQ